MFIEKNKEEYGISVLCDKYEVSTSGYYAWRKRLPSKRAAENELLAKEIRRVHHENREVYGGPRVYKALRAEGYMVNHKRVERIMREEGIRGRICSVYHRSSGSNRFFQKTKNIRKTVPEPTDIDQVWLGDITFIKVKNKWNCLAAIMDVYSRRIVGWALGPQRTSELTTRAFKNALRNRKPEQGMVFHSDRGSEYASYAYQDFLKGHGVIPSMNRVGHSEDNSHMESFFHSFKGELIRGSRFDTQEELTGAINSYIALFYNARRLHSGIGYQSPAQYEKLAG